MRFTRLFSIVLGVLLLCLPSISAAKDSTPAAVEPERPPIERNVVYGEDDPTRQLMHIFRQAPRDDPRPAIVLIHGGGFVSGEPIRASIQRQVFRRQRLRNLPGRLSAVRPNQLERTRFPPHSTTCSSRCAGFARMPRSSTSIRSESARLAPRPAGSSPDCWGRWRRAIHPRRWPSTRAGSNAVASFSGDLDLTVPLNEFWAPLYDQIIGGTLAEHPELYEAASPVFHVDADTAPFLITHGTNDVDSPHQQSLNMVDALTAAGIEFVYAEFPGKDHIGAILYPPVWQLAATFMTYQLVPAR